MGDDLVMAAFARFMEHRENGPQQGHSHESKKKWGYVPDEENTCPHCESHIKRTRHAWNKRNGRWSSRGGMHYRDLLAAWEHCCTVRHIACVMGLTKEQTLELRRVIRAVDLIGGKR